MATQAALSIAIEAALTSGGYTPAPSADLDTWPSWAIVGAGARPWVLVRFEGAETSGVGGGVEADTMPIEVVLLSLAGNPFDAHAGSRASMTHARAMRVLGEAIGDGVAAIPVFTGESRTAAGSGLWLVQSRFTFHQTDTY